jgi:hypothetical protein
MSYGQVAVPLVLTAVPSPLAHTMNVIEALTEYVYVPAVPVHPVGSVGVEFMNGPATWFCAFVCGVSMTVGRRPDAATAVTNEQSVAAETPGAGSAPQCAAKALMAVATPRMSPCALAVRARAWTLE